MPAAGLLSFLNHFSNFALLKMELYSLKFEFRQNPFAGHQISLVEVNQAIKAWSF